jgi:hypothetical protein
MSQWLSSKICQEDVYDSQQNAVPTAQNFSHLSYDTMKILGPIKLANWVCL